MTNIRNKIYHVPFLTTTTSVWVREQVRQELTDPLLNTIGEFKIPLWFDVIDRIHKYQKYQKKLRK